MPSSSAIRVKGYRELSRAFARADKTLKTELRDSLREAAEPVRSTAEGLAKSRIENVGSRWSRMRVGVTTRVVYVAPRERGVTSRARAGYRRPRFGTLLMERAMDPALEQNRDNVERKVEQVLDEVGREWQRRG